MSKVEKSQNETSSAVQKWENTENEPSGTPPAYPQSCPSLETFSCGPDSLPNEILEEIFIYVVYTPGPDETRFPEIKKGIRRIFWRLHCLMAVCSTWRNLVINLPKLWTVIPMAGIHYYLPTSEAVSLALQRSQATSKYRVLHLVAVLSYHLNCPLAPIEHTGLPQYATINIEVQSYSLLYPIAGLLKKVIKFQDPVFLSELSLHHDHCQRPHGGYRFSRPQQNDYLDYQMSDEQYDKLLELLGNVRILRLRNINIHWNTVRLTQVVHFHLQSVVLGNHDELVEFLLMLQHAPRLQTLKLISVDALNRVTNQLYPIPEKIALPELESLVLSDVSFNVLQVVLNSIAPGSHRTKVALTRKSGTTTYDLYHPEGDGSDEEEVQEEVGSKELLDLLKSSNVHTVRYDVSGSKSRWVDQEHLRRMLRSLPSLKSLIMTGWRWDLGVILALKRPRSDKPFPYLTELVIVHGGHIRDARYLPHIAAGHSLRTLVVDGANTLGKHEKIIQRLRGVVPDFRFDPHPEQVEELNHSTWRLW
ncbi:unnamed protein product [Rhizoctonia solani]|uniref:F-box domain-containing protein n=1 Tax=Rhizoctonia solani TaxID=456999 RepID=A0A8H3E4R2_9AGAM|nr:unnamed protein product [Rhizoctonia solani]